MCVCVCVCVCVFMHAYMHSCTLYIQVYSHRTTNVLMGYSYIYMYLIIWCIFVFVCVCLMLVCLSAIHVGCSVFTADEPSDVLDRSHCITALAVLRHLKWFQVCITIDISRNIVLSSNQIVQNWATPISILLPFFLLNTCIPLFFSFFPSLLPSLSLSECGC